MDTTTQVLDLSYNKFGKIGESVFRERNLFNLQKIFLHHCGISMVVGRCFEGITNLVEVDLSRNLLNNVPKEALRDCGYLMVLNLRGNPIRQVPGDAFLKLQELQTLDLAECQITSIQPEALNPLHNLVWLKLESNLLVHLDPLSGFPNSELFAICIFLKMKLLETICNLALRKVELIRIQAFAGSLFKTTNGTVTVISLLSKVNNKHKRRISLLSSM